VAVDPDRELPAVSGLPVDERTVDRTEWEVACDQLDALARIDVDVLVEVLAEELVDVVAEHPRQRRVRVANRARLRRPVHPIGERSKIA